MQHMWLAPCGARHPLTQPLLVTLTGTLCTRLQLGGMYYAIGQLRPVDAGGAALPEDTLHASHQVRR